MMTPAMQATQPQNIPQTTALLMDMKNKGTLQSYVAQHQNDPGYGALLSLAMTINQAGNDSKALQAQLPQQTVSQQELAKLNAAPTQTAGLPSIMPSAAPSAAPGMPPSAAPNAAPDPETMLRQAIDARIAAKDFEGAQKLIKELAKIDEKASPDANKLPEERGIATLNPQASIPDGGIAGEPDEAETKHFFPGGSTGTEDDDTQNTPVVANTTPINPDYPSLFKQNPAKPVAAPTDFVHMSPQDTAKFIQSYNASNPDPFATQTQTLLNAQNTAAQNALERTKSSIANQGVYGAAQEQRLNAREQKLADAENKNYALSFILGGFKAMSAVPGSKDENGNVIAGGLGGLSSGVQTGIKHYIAGQDKIEQARDTLNEAKDKLDFIRFNQKNLNNKELDAAHNAVDNSVVKGMETGIAGLRQREGVNNAQALAILKTGADAQMNSEKNATSVQVAKIGYQGSIPALYAGIGGGDMAKGFALAHQPDSMKMALALGVGDTQQEKIADGLSKFTMATTKESLPQAWARYQAAWAGKESPTSQMKSAEDFAREWYATQRAERRPDPTNNPGSGARP